MDASEFSALSPGQLVRIVDGVAFVPDDLPPDLKLGPAQLIALDRARGALSELVGQARLIANLDLLLGPLTNREAVLSSRIEGTHTEVREVLRANASPTLAVDENSDLFEVMNYLRAQRLAQDWVNEGRPINVMLIRALHQELLRGVRGERKHPGMFRTTQVYIGNRDEGLRFARFVPAPPEQVVPLLEGLMQFIGQQPVFGSIVDCALIHYQFETIHPFEDGNGRLGRLLIPLTLLAADVMERPVLYLSPYLERHRDTYLDLLKEVSTHGAWTNWIEFFAGAVQAQAHDTRQRVQRLMDLNQRYHTMLRAARATRAALDALPVIMEKVYVTAPRIAEAINVSHPTARTALEQLSNLGILVASGKVHGAQEWVARELLESVYET